MNTRQERKFDLILFGATGFTGKLVAEYLLAQYGVGGDLHWALAGRNSEKLAAVALDLGPTATDLPLLKADSASATDMQELAANARVICSTVGPYARYGSALIAACAKLGTHYCDLTAEVPWMVRMMKEHQQTAVESGARIIHACGFDSIPSDLGTFFVHAEMNRTHRVSCREIKFRVDGFSGGFSGGTVASMIYMMEEAEKDDSIRQLLEEPYALNPPDKATGPDTAESLTPEYDSDFAQWRAPFPMAPINTKIVRRSNALLEYAYGRDVRYGEAILTGKGLRGMLRATSVSLGSGLSTALMSIAPIRRFLAGRLPAPGEGPTAAERDAGYWEVRIRGKHPLDPQKDITARLRGDRDPGYGSTSKMLGEAAVCLALDTLPARAGFLTTAVAMGDALILRLQDRAGITFTID